MNNSPLLSLTLAAATAAAAQHATPPDPVLPVPSPQQLAWQRMELTMFLHFGVNTFTDREWGEGTEDEAVFNPTELDCRQWARVAREAGFKLAILTAKHHDGFCLWPSKYTEHSVKRSPWKDGKGDVVREFTEACRAEGLKAGLYLSPWDRNQPVYGDSPKYNEYFCNQLTELMTQYGAIDEVWFDGACGEGPNGKRQEYDWNSFHDTVYAHNPQAIIAICGPDVRWVGNESGVARPGESSVQTRAEKKVWYPAECDVSIRPGWFYHASQDGQVKSLDHLLDLYFKSVGRNSVLLLNVPPARRGLLADPDAERLREFRQVLNETFGTNLAAGAAVKASAVRGGDEQFGAQQVLDGSLETYWATDDATTEGWLEIDLPKPATFNVVNVQEALPLGERVEQYRVEAEVDGAWTTLGHGTVIGHNSLIRLPRTTASKVRLVVEAAKVCPAIAEFGLYLCPRDENWPKPSLTAHKPAEASNVHPAGTVFGGDKAVDNDPSTRWATSDETRECWLEVDLLQEYEIGNLGISELEPRLTKFRLEYRSAKEQDWLVAYEGTNAGKLFAADFLPVTARYVRLHILEATFAPTIWEFEVFPPKGK